MVELQHRAAIPLELHSFLQAHPRAGVADFDSWKFQPAKRAVKAALSADQEGLCVYCERRLAADDGQLEHIKPKGGPNAHPLLCFTYTNFAHSCINDHTCGQKKQNGLLPIEPGPNCNADWTLSTDGAIEPTGNQTRARKHAVRQTRDMLGLNNAALMLERRRFLDTFVRVLRETPNDSHQFLDLVPFRYILGTVL